MTTLTEPAALEWLRARAAEVPPHLCIVEVGVYQGGSLAELAKGARRGGAPVYGIDVWGLEGALGDKAGGLARRFGDDRFMARAQRAAPDAILLRGYGAEVGRKWNGPPVGLLFIDAIHEEPNVLEDFDAWEPHLAPGAWVAFDDHDDRFPGVGRAVAKLVAAGRLMEPLIVGSHLAVSTGGRAAEEGA